LDSEVLLNKSALQINALIGEPTLLHNSKSSNLRHYMVYEKYEWDIDPEELLLLEIEFNQKNISNSIRLISTK